MVKEDCIFCKIANGSIPSKTIYEDEKCKITLNTEHVKLETEEEIKISNKGKRIQIVL